MNKLSLMSLLIIRLLEESQFFCVQHVPSQHHTRKVIRQSCWSEAAPSPSSQSSPLCATRGFHSFIHFLSLQKKRVHQAPAKAASGAGAVPQVGNSSAVRARISCGRTKDPLWGTRHRRAETAGSKGSDTCPPKANLKQGHTKR